MKEKRERNKEIWNEYNELKITQNNKENKIILKNQTKLFFDRLPNNLLLNIRNSKNPIVQFGSGAGLYLSEIMPNRIKIGYDYSEYAVNNSKLNQIRCVDLNEIAENTLTYLPLIKEDSEMPVDYLFIRVLEYLTPDALRLLLIALIDHSKSGSNIYIEILNNNEPLERNQKESACFMNSELPNLSIKKGYLASFFGARTDMKFESWSIAHNLPEDFEGVDNFCETLVIHKI